MADVTGARYTDNVTQAIRKVDMVPTIKELEPSATPLTVLTMMIDSKPAVNPKFSWIEDDLPPRFDAINNGAGYSDSATSIVVDNGPYFAPNELWKVTRTGEIIRVDAVSTNTLTAVRGIGGGAAAILDNDELMKLSSTFAENSLAPVATSQNPVEVINYTQIVRDSVEASETWRGSETFTTPDDWTRMTSKKMIEHKLKLEQMYLHGKPTEDTTGAPIRTTGGAYHFVQTNRTDMGGTMTEDEFLGIFSQGFRFGDKQSKIGLASRLAVDVCNSFPRGKLELVQADNDKTYGLSIMKYISPHGVLKLVTHNMLEGAVYGGHILGLDISQLRKRPMRDGDGGTRDTHVKEHVETPGQDGRKDVVTTEIGLEFGLERTHFLATGITG